MGFVTGSTKLSEVEGELHQKQDELGAIFAKYPDLNMPADVVADIKSRNNELADLGKKYEEAKELDGIYQKNVAYLREQQRAAAQLPFNTSGKSAAQTAVPPQHQVKTLGEMFIESPEYKGRKRGGATRVDFNDFDSKTLMTTAAGFAPETTRTGRVIESAQRRPMVDEVIPQTTTTQTAVVYMQETTFTNNAAEAAEGAAYGEGALVYTEQSSTVRKIATFLPVTDEQMEDVPQMQSLINNRLTLMIRLRREAQLLVGDGVSPNLLGFLNTPSIQTQAKGADPTPDAVYKAMTKVRHTGYADPTAVIFHPNDWQDIRLLRTIDGIYIWGSPAEPGPERIWGLPIISTTAETENTGLVGDFQLYSEIFFKKGITIEVSNSHDDYFVKGKQAVRADERLALVVYRATAFCTVTGI